MQRSDNGAGARARPLPPEDVDALRRVLDAVPHPIFVKDDDHRFVVVNESMCAFMGRRFDELVGRKDEDFVPPKVAEVFRRNDRLVLDSGQENENEEVIPAPDGRIRTIVTRKKRACLASGTRLLIGCISDVSDLKRREASWRHLFDNNPVPMWVFEKATLRFLAVNQAALEHYGYGRDEFLTMSALDIRPPEEADAFREVAGTRAGAIETGRTWRHLKADGSLIDIVAYAHGLDYDGQEAVMVAVVDVTKRKRAEDELRRTRAFLDTIIDNVPVMLFVKEAHEHRYLLINRAGEELIGLPREEVIGRTDHDLFPKDQADTFFIRDEEVLRADRLQIVEEEKVPTRRDGVRELLTKRLAFAGADGRSKFLLGIAEDVTERNRHAARIAHLANFDVLTDLPNRGSFAERLDFTLDRASVSGEPFAVLCLDLDRFKEVNQVLGQSAGDAMLREMSRRLQAEAGNAFLARIGGDEFALIAAGGPQPASAVALAERLLAAVAEDFSYQGQRFRAGLSIGIAFYPSDGDDAASLLANAEAALYRAKADGRGVFRAFEADMDKRLRERRALQLDLGKALERNELEIHYQPQAEVCGEVAGFEALVRWRHPVRGLVSPADFIPLAEESGLIIAIGTWVLREACREAASWPNPVYVSVNLSPLQLQVRHGDLPALVHTVLIETGLAPERLELEITEGVLFENFSHATSILRRLKALGVKIAMDDFGTGYSSLSYLQAFPFDKIKIDKSFTDMIGRKPQSDAIVRAIAGLGRGLSMTVVAEGVETPAQADFLREEGCHELQGYLIGRPLPIEDYAEAVGRPAVAKRQTS